jgi:hypothetical protein
MFPGIWVNSPIFEIEVLKVWGAVPAHDQPRISLLLRQRGVERFRQDARNLGAPDIPGDVA